MVSQQCGSGAPQPSCLPALSELLTRPNLHTLPFLPPIHQGKGVSLHPALWAAIVLYFSQHWQGAPVFYNSWLAKPAQGSMCLLLSPSTSTESLCQPSSSSYLLNISMRSVIPDTSSQKDIPLCLISVQSCTYNLSHLVVSDVFANLQVNLNIRFSERCLFPPEM